MMQRLVLLSFLFIALPAVAQTTAPATLPTTREAVRVRPGPDNTGPIDPKKLKIVQKLKVNDGDVLENLYITASVNASDTRNVTIRNCVIDAGNAPYGVRCQNAQNLLIERCEIVNVASAGVFGDGFTARANQIYQSGGDGFKPGRDALIEGNWVHTLGYQSKDAHADGVQIRAGRNVRIVGNYFDMPINVADTKSNAGVLIQGVKNKGGSRDIVVEDNWFRGGNFTVHAFSDGDEPSTIRVENNTFFRGQSRYGSGRVEPGVIWRGNKFEDGNLTRPKDK